jgi:hypothetical protein
MTKTVRKSFTCATDRLQYTKRRSLERRFCIHGIYRFDIGWKMRSKVTGAKRWVVKIGSALLTADGKGLDRGPWPSGSSRWWPA